ncbi:MAG: calcium/sodium antiporter [Candidatus Halichondribacter symbioticus]
MPLLQNWLFIASGLALLVIGGSFLVKGTVALAERLGISALVISLTVVAFGTSAPELLVAIQAVLAGAPELALGNVVGSNTANVLLILGLPMAIFTLNLSPKIQTESRGNFAIMLGATVVFSALCWMGAIGRVQGVILLICLGAILTRNLQQARIKPQIKPHAQTKTTPTLSLPKALFALLIGLAALPLGGKLLIDGAINIAMTFNIAPAVIGLTLVALGTSLPELATSLSAAYHKRGDIVIGNIIGSNLFNLLAIPGIAAMVAPLPVPGDFLTRDLWVMGAATLALTPFIVFGWRMGRIFGGLFVICYGLYSYLLLYGSV